MQRFVLHHQFVKFYETELDKEKETEPAGAGCCNKWLRLSQLSGG